MTDHLLSFYTLALLGLIGVIFWFMPRLTVASLFFAVTVPPELRDSAEGRAITSRFRWRVALLTAALMIAAMAWDLATAGQPVEKRAGGTLAVQFITLFVQVLGAFIFFQQARGRVRPHAVAPTTVREALLRPPRPRLRRVMNVLSVGPFLLIAGAAYYIWRHWAELPERYPIHWNAAGHPNGWATKTPMSVGATLFVAAVMAAFLIGLNLLIRHTRRTHVSGGPGRREERIRLVCEVLLVGMAYGMVLIFVPVTVWLPFRHTTELPGSFLAVTLGSTLGFIIVMVGALIWAARQDGETEPSGDRTDDRFWKWGLIYYNPGDPAILVEKRFGIGWTLNFGRPGAWILLLALLSPPLIIAIVLALTKH